MTSPSSSTRDASAPRPGQPAGARVASSPATTWEDWGPEQQPWPAPLAAADAARFRGERRSPSPWHVVGLQVVVGLAIVGLATALLGRPGFWAALYGAAAATVPSALMARFATRLLDSRSPVTTAVWLLACESGKLVCSAAMLAIAFRTLHPTPAGALALLGALAGCLSVYGWALAWRPASKTRLGNS